MSRFEIRALGPGDEAVLSLLAVESAQFEDAQTATSPQPLEAEDASAFLKDLSAQLWVAFDGQRPVGFALAYALRRRHGDPSQLFLYELGVRSDRRRQGVGTTLVRHVLRWARDGGIRRGFVLTGEQNLQAAAFYRSLGWRADEERDLVYRFRTDDPTG
jgi:GNAT superfamily N-acetyltransferase